MEIFEFDSLEEAFEFMRARTAEANASLLPQQRGIDYGSKVVRVYEGGLLIFGEVWTKEEFEATEAGNYSDLSRPEEALEFAAVCRDTAEMHDNGYMLGRWYSIIEPAGEIGSTHRASCWPISDKAFEEARAVVWDCSDEATPTLWAELDAIPRG